MHQLTSCSVRTVAVTRRWKLPDQNCTHKPRDSECLAVSFKMRSCQLTHSMRPWMRPVSLVTRQNCSLGMAVAGYPLAGVPCGRRLSRKCHPWLTCRDSKDRKRKRERDEVFSTAHQISLSTTRKPSTRAHQKTPRMLSCHPWRRGRRRHNKVKMDIASSSTRFMAWRRHCTFFHVYIYIARPDFLLLRHRSWVLKTTVIV